MQSLTLTPTPTPTPRCASQLREVKCYPVTNTAAAQGLLAIQRSEIYSLRSDMDALEGRAATSKRGAAELDDGRSMPMHACIGGMLMHASAACACMHRRHAHACIGGMLMYA